MTHHSFAYSQGEQGSCIHAENKTSQKRTKYTPGAWTTTASGLQVAEYLMKVDKRLQDRKRDNHYIDDLSLPHVTSLAHPHAHTPSHTFVPPPPPPHTHTYASSESHLCHWLGWHDQVGVVPQIQRLQVLQKVNSLGQGDQLVIV